MLRDGRRLAAHWLPKGVSELEKQSIKASQEFQQYRQRRQQIAAQKPRKVRLLWILPLPLIPATLFSLAAAELTLFIANAAAYSLYVVGAMLAQHGFKQQVKLQQELHSSASLPFKTLAALTVSLATVITAWFGAGHPIPVALAFGAGTFVAFVMLYGLDPRRKVSLAESYSGSNKRVSEALQLAEQKIIDIQLASQRITQTELNQRLNRIISLAREILAELARDPRDLRLARKFLNTYLDGAQRVVSGYAETHANGRSRTLEANFRRILVTIEDVFSQQLQRLLDNELQDLDIQMEVLETQLKNEGLN